MSVDTTQSSADTGEISLARFEPDEKWGSPLALYRALRECVSSIWTKEMFAKPMVLKESAIADILFLSDPDGIRHVLMENVERYPKSPIQQRFLKPSLGDGLLTAEGEVWRTQRHAANPSFRAEQLTRVVPAIVSAVEERLSAWRDYPNTVPVDIHQEMMELTLEVLCQSLFSGVEVDRKALGHAVTYYVETMGSIGILDFLTLPQWLPSLKLRRAQWSIDHLHNETARIVRERQEQTDKPEDLLSMLMQARDDQTGNSLGAKQLQDTMATLLSAGHETTAITMTMLFYLLNEFPWALRKIREEVDEVLGDRQLEAGDLKGLRFTRMVVEEALRLYPPSALLIRVAAEDDVICGQKIRKGTTVTISQYMVQRHQALWDNPDMFDPYRFSPENKSKIHRFSYMPFSLGPRSCIGSTFAMMELTAALALIAREFDIVRVDDAPIELQLKITLRLKERLMMFIKPRQKEGAGH